MLSLAQHHLGDDGIAIERRGVSAIGHGVYGSAFLDADHASQKEALLAMLPSSILTMQPRGGRGDVSRLAGLARDLPAYRLDIGREVEGIPPCIEEILAAAAG